MGNRTEVNDAVHTPPTFAYSVTELVRRSISAPSHPQTYTPRHLQCHHVSRFDRRPMGGGAGQYQTTTVDHCEDWMLSRWVHAGRQVPGGDGLAGAGCAVGSGAGR
jgi:hypothetical protein